MKYQETVAAVNGVIRQYSMALTLRQIYYRLVAAGLIPNRRTSYNGLSAQLVTARENGDVDEGSIVDRSRSINDNSFDSPEDFLDAAIYTAKNKYMRRFWASQGKYVEIWVEKDALSQVLSGAIRDFNTVVCPSRGYSSFSYIKEAATRFENHTSDLDENPRLSFFTSRTTTLRGLICRGTFKRAFVPTPRTLKSRSNGLP